MSSFALVEFWRQASVFHPFYPDCASLIKHEFLGSWARHVLME